MTPQPLTPDPTDAPSIAPPWADAPAFIEHQFPVAKISMESYKERKSNYSQTLTGLGKWWGRKPLVLVRAALLGLLLPATDDPARDREIFLKLMTMDREGLVRRNSKSIPGNRLVEELITMPPSVRDRFLDPEMPPNAPLLRRLSREDRAELQALVFERMSYGEKLQFCDRPEQIDGPDAEAWVEINAHLGTQAATLAELVADLGERRFGHRPRVGDAFCGGGSIPFEAARLGCDAYGSDLNPVAALLTWASLNIVGGGQEVADAVAKAQKQVYDAVDRQITEWGIEHNSLGWRADAYLYCVEVRDPESGWMIPLAPNWVIGQKSHTIARLIPDPTNKRYDIEIHQGVSAKELAQAKETGTVAGSRLIPPDGGPSTPIEVIRQGLRLWEAQDIVPRPDDVFQERLYCVRWVETYIDAKGKERTRKHYRTPTAEDFKREDRVLALLRDRFDAWQEKGYIPSRYVESGDKTEELIRTRGWSYWHQLYLPRQLLTNGLFQNAADRMMRTDAEFAAAALGAGRLADWNGKLTFWDSTAANEKLSHTFSNQALNPMNSFGARGHQALNTTWFSSLKPTELYGSGSIETTDARQIKATCQFWITDPPYADAVNYHELSEFFLAWQEKNISKKFPQWYTDSKRSLAVTGSDTGFRANMVACYRNLAEHMPDNGMQIVMFTHQDAGVWADLTMILWAAGLRVTAAWTIATETDSAMKQGNYVQGTVLLVLRKRTEADPLFMDELVPLIEQEVTRQLDAMLALEDDSDPNFGDADYQLAAYAAALRVLTAQPLEDIDPAREILRERLPGEEGPVERLIRNAVKIACDHLVPKGYDEADWKRLGAMERFYLKGLEVESHGEYRNGVYQELARGFGAADYTDLLASTQANETRLKSAGELGKRMLSGDGFAGSLLRQALFAVHQVAKGDDVQAGLNWLRTEIPDYWGQRRRLERILDYLAATGRVTSMTHWRKDAPAAALLAGAVRNDHV